MKNIITIYKQDIKHIATNWPTAVIIIGLIFLPSLYAWFNIEASWDPYSNTEQIKIAVTNDDAGAVILGEEINIGNEVIAALEKNKNLGWTFLDDETEGRRGVEHGNYYASLVIPKNFSEKIATVLTDNPAKPEIVYTVNEKINAIAPKMTSTGATAVVEEISTNFVKVATETIFEVVNTLGVELKKELPSIKRVRDLIFQLEEKMPELQQQVNIAIEDVEKAQTVVVNAKKQIPVVTDLAENGLAFSNNLKEFLEKGQQLSQTVTPNVKQNLLLLMGATEAAPNIIGTLDDIDPEIIEQTNDRIQMGITLSHELITLFTRLNTLAGEALFGEEIKQLHNITTLLGQQTKALEQIQAGTQPFDEAIAQLEQLTVNTTTVENVINRFDKEIAPKITQGFSKAQQTAEKAQTILTEMNQMLPDVQKILDDATKGITFGKNEIIAIKKSMPATETKIKSIADHIRKFEQEADVDEVIALLINDYQKESDFFANPVLLKEKKLFPIPNYGSAMSPFFSVLSLWVGALLLVSLLTVHISNEKHSFTSTHIYFGRLLTFLTIALLQSFIVTLGDLYLLHTYVTNPLAFVLLGLFISATFMVIVYTLVSVFGNVGKALAIILLVLQIAGSGGTFPIQVTPPFFQTIYPLLPFTYAISMMREAVGGILWEIVFKDIAILSIFIVIALLFGLLLKKPINKWSEPLTKKAKKGKLIH